MPGYPPGFYGHYPPLASKQSEGHPVYSTPQYFLAPVPHPMAPPQGAPEGDPNMYPPQGYYQTAVLTPLPYHPQYAMPRADGSALINQYPVYPGQLYKSTTNPQGVMIGGGSAGVGDGEDDIGKAV